MEHQGLFDFLKTGLFALPFIVNPSEHEFTYNQLYLNIKLQFVIEIVLSHIWAPREQTLGAPKKIIQLIV